MRTFLKRAGLVVAGLVALLLVAAAVMYVIGGRKTGRTYEIQTAALRVSADSAAVARGAHIAETHGCRSCHTPNLGGQVMVDAPPFRVVASNLTRGRGGIGAAYEDRDWDRTIRHGVRPDGRPVFIMPSAAFHGLSDADAADLIAYLKSVPPVDNELPATEIRALGRLIVATGGLDPAMEVRAEPARATAPAADSSAAYGAYLVSTICQYCHGEDLRGMQPPDPNSPVAPSLSAAAAWPLARFAAFLRTGERPDGSHADTTAMPIDVTRHYTASEVQAIHAHLGTLEWGAPAPSASAGS